MCTPLLKGSVLDCLMATCSKWGLSLLSTAMSFIDRWSIGSYDAALGVVNSLTRRKLKKARQHAAHNIMSE